MVVNSIDNATDGNVIINGEYAIAAGGTTHYRRGDLIELEAAASSDTYTASLPRERVVAVPSYTGTDPIMSLIVPTPYVNIPLAFLEHAVQPGRSARCVFVSLCAAISTE